MFRVFKLRDVDLHAGYKQRVWTEHLIPFEADSAYWLSHVDYRRIGERFGAGSFLLLSVDSSTRIELELEAVTEYREREPEPEPEPDERTTSIDGTTYTRAELEAELERLRFVGATGDDVAAEQKRRFQAELDEWDSVEVTAPPEAAS